MPIDETWPPKYGLVEFLGGPLDGELRWVRLLADLSFPVSPGGADPLEPAPLQFELARYRRERVVSEGRYTREVTVWPVYVYAGSNASEVIRESFDRWRHPPPPRTIHANAMDAMSRLGIDPIAEAWGRVIAIPRGPLLDAYLAHLVDRMRLLR